MKSPLKRIGIVVKHHNPEAAKLAKQAEKLIKSLGKEVLWASEEKSKTKLLEGAELILVFGGDGTYISIARRMADREVPIMGINMGQLGFLTEFKKEEALDALKRILKHGEMQISKRSLLEVTLKRAGRTLFKGPVVNDAVVSKGAIARIFTLELKIDGQWVNDIRSDGLIISTPTGSTAYSLAAGGPILQPTVPGMILAAICPHSLTQRPLVICDDSVVQLRLSDQRKTPAGHVFLTLDGQDVFELKEGDLIFVQKYAGHTLQMVTSPKRSYFGLLREKFKFGERA